MKECNLPHIPSRLHTNQRPIIKAFEVDEFLYRRCKPEELENPFKTVSIRELSHNRSGLEQNILCNPEDVLFNIIQDDDKERYEEMVVCTLKIKSLTDDNKYKKNYEQIKGGKTYTCQMELLHEPEPCMYPHCVFRIFIDGIVVDKDNYDITIKKLNEIRTRLKEELASIIFRREVRQEEETS